MDTLTSSSYWSNAFEAAFDCLCGDAKSGIRNIDDPDNEDADTWTCLVQCRDSVDLGLSWRMFLWRSENVLLAEARRNVKHMREPGLMKVSRGTSTSRATKRDEGGGVGPHTTYRKSDMNICRRKIHLSL